MASAPLLRLAAAASLPVGGQLICRLICRLVCVGIGLSGALVAPPAHAQPPERASLLEQVIRIPKKAVIGSIDLETTVFTPPGPGPFPLVIINHGKAEGNPAFQARARYVGPALEFVRRGYMVALPMRQGFSNSQGYYVDSGCNLVGNGLAQAEDVRAAIDYLTTLQTVDKSAILVMGQSHGGMTTLAFGTFAYPGVRALVNFAGGLRQTNCSAWEHTLITAASEFGQRTRIPSLWFYGTNDSYFPPFVYRGMFERYRALGGPAELVEFGIWPHGDAHGMFGTRAGQEVWLPKVQALMEKVGLPTAVRFQVSAQTHASAAPPASGYAKVEDVQALPARSAAAREGYGRFLASEFPRAYAVSPGGAWSWFANRPDAMAAAVARCNQFARDNSCALYAVDHEVVWVAPQRP